MGKPGRPKAEHKSINRNIRLNDEEWQIFRCHFGPVWLRKKIAEKIMELAGKKTPTDQGITP